LAALFFLENSADLLKNKAVTLHFDNINASLICKKGSNKPRLQKYALEIANLCDRYNIFLRPVWIPRDLNMAADYISKQIDYDDYYVSMGFFREVCDDFLLTPDIDCFANGHNTRLENFFSLFYYKNCTGVDCFNYNWKIYGLAWLFPPPRLVVRALLHLQKCKSQALLLVPQWLHSHFYPFLIKKRMNGFVRKVWTYSGKDIFRHGADKRSYFGPHFLGNVEVWYMDYDTP